MPLEFGLWRIDGDLAAVDWGAMDLEERLEGILDRDITVAADNWMVIGRQVLTDHGGRIDLLAIDRGGNLVVIELKRDKTPRDIVAQSLDYGSWVSELDDEAIVQIFATYLKEHHAERGAVSINDAFQQRFHVPLPDELNASHELVIVAASLDPSTERIVRYLAAEYGVRINALFFRVFKDEEREYLARAWLREQSDVEAKPVKGPALEWNGEYYVSFGGDPNRSWDEAARYGFIAAGGGAWYTTTLGMLSPGDRVWVYIPGAGYVGVGEVQGAVTALDDFTVIDEAGHEVPLVGLPVKAAGLTRAADDPDKAEYLVSVKWVKTVPATKAVKEKGFFGNQNTVARPTTAAWGYTVDRLKQRWGIE